MAYSAGFSPHPKVSYAGASPTGVASEAEYLEVGLAAAVNPRDLQARLDQALSPGLDVIEVVEAGGSSLAERLEASRWEILLRGVGEAAVGAAIHAYLSASSIKVERLTKQGMRTLDARGPVLDMKIVNAPSGPDIGVGPDACAIIHVVVRHTTPAVRPDDVLAGLRQAADLAPPVPPLATRLAQGPLDAESGTVSDPLDQDRVAVSTADETSTVSSGAEPA
jgi:radical SAM-linked protein